MTKLCTMLPSGCVAMLCVSISFAQPSSPRRIAPGIVTGHVFCGDTQRPARLAKVALVSAVLPNALTEKERERNDEIGSSPASDFVETRLDGSFKISNVRPGQYYVIVDKEGYTLPLAEFTQKDLSSVVEKTKARMGKVLKAIIVVSDQAVNQEITLERGAAAGGTVTYDDGSPAGGLDVTVLSKGDDGKWTAGIAQRYRSMFGREKTDDNGRYRVTGLPPGEYMTQVELTLNEYTTTTTPATTSGGQASVMRMQQSKYSLPLFSGNVLRKQNGVPYVLGRGEERAGVDLQFPLSKLHKVTGQAVAKDGHALNGGKATLVNADDQSKVTDAEVDFTDSTFHLEFVPEGDFLLKISDAKDLTKVQVANAPGSVPRFHEDTKSVRNFGDAEQPLKVQGETTGVVVTVPEAARVGPLVCRADPTRFVRRRLNALS